MTLPREARDSRVFFVRCEVLDASGTVVDENVYWQSQRNDDVGAPDGDYAFELHQESFADMTPLNSMAAVRPGGFGATDRRRGRDLTAQPDQVRSPSSSAPR